MKPSIIYLKCICIFFLNFYWFYIFQHFEICINATIVLNSTLVNFKMQFLTFQAWLRLTFSQKWQNKSLNLLKNEATLYRSNSLLETPFWNPLFEIICTRRSKFLTHALYLSWFWPVRQSSATVELNLTPSQNTPISWYTYRYTWRWPCFNRVMVLKFWVH